VKPLGASGGVIHKTQTEYGNVVLRLCSEMRRSYVIGIVERLNESE
jgi:hypothetical protein